MSEDGPAMLQGLLRSYSQVLFSRQLLVGLVILLATLLDLQVGLFGVVAVVLAALLSQLLGLSPETRREGLLGYNALLVGLGVGAILLPGPHRPLILLLAVATAVVGTAALRAWQARTGLPALTLPFVLTLFLIWMLGSVVGLQVPPPTSAPSWMPELLATGLKALGGLFFVPRVEAGALILVALVLWSRQGAVLALIGLLVAAVLSRLVPVTDPTLAPVLGTNLALTAIALGGVWFVPSGASYAVGALGAAVAGLLTLGLAPLMTRWGLPLSILPFNLTVLTMLLAMRQRVADRSPKAVDFVPGTPEQNLATYRTRLARFGAHYLVRFRAPVMGTWTVTQSEGDGPTHREAWSSAIDLEVADGEGGLHRGSGSQRDQYLCWRLPVVACADGTVARVVDGIADNAVGEVDLDDNWGNAVVLEHAPGLYSVVAHLARGSIRVEEGMRVRRGDELGRCGSSGRSPRPHLHFQLQASSELGAPTLPLELHDVVHEEAEGPRLRATWLPRTGDRLRNLVPEASVEELVGFTPGRPLRFEVDGGAGRRAVTLTPEIDLQGRRVLSDGEGGRLYFGQEDDLFVVYEALADRGSVLHAIHTGLARLPLELPASAPSWTDALPARSLLHPLARPLYDLVAPFVRWRGLRLRYRLEAEGEAVVVHGEAMTGQSVQTRAELVPGRGLVALDYTAGGQTLRLSRLDEEQRAPVRDKEVAK